MAPLFEPGKVEEIKDEAPLPSNVVEWRQNQQRVLRAMEDLPENQQEVVRLKFQNGLSYREISKVTGLSESNVGFLIHTAVKRLREKIGARENAAATSGGGQ